jgi:hypothetical protein
MHHRVGAPKSRDGGITKGPHTLTEQVPTELAETSEFAEGEAHITPDTGDKYGSQVQQ